MGMLTSMAGLGELERPIVDVGPLQSIFVNGISDVEVIGSNSDVLRLTFYVDGRKTADDAPIAKIPVTEIIISVADFVLHRAIINAKLKAYGINAGGMLVGAN